MISATGQNLAFLLSTPRAGSTLLSVLLNQCPGVLCPPEPWFLLRLLALADRHDGDAPYDDATAGIGTANFLGGDLLADASRSFACTAYNRALARTGKTRFVDKTPRYYHLLPQLGILFPDADFIWLQRNPLDVLASYRDTWQLDVATLLRPPVRPESLDFLRGLDVLKDFFGAAHPRRHVVRYEDLVARPAETMAPLQRALGLGDAAVSRDITAAALEPFRDAPVGDPNIHATRTLHTRSVGRWRSVLTEAEVRLALEVLGADIFHAMGYADVVAEAKDAGWKLPEERRAHQHREQVAASWESRIGGLRRELDNVSRVAREQREFIARLEAERDRAAADATERQSTADKLAAVTQQQEAYIARLEEERDRSVAEARESRRAAESSRQDSQREIDSLLAQLRRAAEESQRHIDDLLAQLQRAAVTMREQTDYIAFLKQQPPKSEP